MTVAVADEDARGPDPGEPQTVQLRLSPSSNLILLVLSAAAALIGVTFAVFIARRDLGVGRGVSLAVFLGVLVAVLGTIHHVRSTEYLVADGSAVARTGILSDRMERINLDQVASIEVDEPAYKRLFSMGDLRLEPSSPGASAVRFASVRDPRTRKAHLVQLVEAPSRDEEAPSSASATHSSNGSSRA